MSVQVSGDVQPANHPLASRMGLIAIVNANLAIASVFGTFSVLLASAGDRFGGSIEWAVAGISALNFAASLSSPFVGKLVQQRSLRSMMISGGTLNVLGFTLLATTHSFIYYLIAYSLLLGVGLAVVGYVLPGTLITRWFRSNQGRALGLTYAPVAFVPLPIVTDWVLRNHGLTVTYAMLATLALITVAAGAFIVDHPPQSSDTVDHPTAVEVPAMAMSDLIRRGRMWAVIGVAVVILSLTYLYFALTVQFALSWGFSTESGALLISIASVSGIFGTMIAGWLSDRIGGRQTLMLLAFGLAAMCLALLIPQPFWSVALVFGAIGFLTSGVIPCTGVALVETVGEENFSTAFGIYNLACLPLGACVTPLATAAYGGFHSYASVFAVFAVCLGLSGIIALTVTGTTSGSAVGES